MRPIFAVLLFASLTGLGPQATAEEVDKMLFIAEPNGDSAYVLDETGTIRAVIEGWMGKRPKKCPPSAYWTESIPVDAHFTSFVVSCDDDAKVYDLKKTNESARKGGFNMILISDPKPPEDPGPRKSDPTANPEANP